MQPLPFPFHYGSILTLLGIRPRLAPRLVSIPLWFDSNPHQDELLVPGGDKFPFHYGSILTKGRQGRISRGVMFPFHYGSILTLQAEAKGRPGVYVSIPLWFDSNRPGAGPLHRNAPVSIPLWFDSN